MHGVMIELATLLAIVALMCCFGIGCCSRRRPPRPDTGGGGGSRTGRASGLDDEWDEGDDVSLVGDSFDHAWDTGPVGARRQDLEADAESSKRTASIFGNKTPAEVAKISSSWGSRRPSPDSHSNSKSSSFFGASTGLFSKPGAGAGAGGVGSGVDYAPVASDINFDDSGFEEDPFL